MTKRWPVWDVASPLSLGQYLRALAFGGAAGGAARAANDFFYEWTPQVSQALPYYVPRAVAAAVCAGMTAVVVSGRRANARPLGAAMVAIVAVREPLTSAITGGLFTGTILGLLVRWFGRPGRDVFKPHVAGDPDFGGRATADHDGGGRCTDPGGRRP